MARPTINSEPMEHELRCRIDEPTLQKIDEICSEEECTRSEVIRYIIYRFFSGK